MPPTDPDVLLYLHSGEGVVTEYVTPIAKALQAAWTGRVLVAGTDAVQVRLGAGTPQVLIHGEDVMPGRVFSRAVGVPAGATISRALAAFGARLVNTPTAALLAGSKFEAAAVMSAAGLPVPPQLLVMSDRSGKLSTDEPGYGWPLVAKMNRGFAGAGVFLADDRQGLAERLAMDRPYQPWVAQRFLTESAGRSLRLLVVDGDVVATLEHRSLSGDFRSCNGVREVTAVAASELELDIARQAVALLGLHVAGVDLLRTDDGPVISEVNPSPGLTNPAAHYPHVYAQVAAAVARA